MPKPKTLSPTDPNLLLAVRHLRRSQTTYGWMLIGFGLLTQLVAYADHPVAGFPFMALGFFCLRWGDPALLPAVAAAFIAAIAPTLNARLSVFGPDPVVRLTNAGGIEVTALIAIKAILGINAVHQFFQFRLLYGTATATSDEPALAIIPPMIANRSDGIGRWARWVGLAGLTAALFGLAFLLTAPAAAGARVTAEMGGALGVLGLGLGIGAAFSPTSERPAALLGVAAGLPAYLLATTVLLQLPA